MLFNFSLFYKLSTVWNLSATTVFSSGWRWKHAKRYSMFPTRSWNLNFNILPKSKFTVAVFAVFEGANLSLVLILNNDLMET
jgi:hypothetical protein